MNKHQYAVVDHAGRYADYTKVYATFETLAEADAYARRGGLAVLAGEFAVGDQVHRIEAERHEKRAAGERGAE